MLLLLAFAIVIFGSVLVFVGSASTISAGGCFFWPFPIIFVCGTGTGGVSASILIVAVVIAVFLLSLSLFWTWKGRGDYLENQRSSEPAC